MGAGVETRDPLLTALLGTREVEVTSEQRVRFVIAIAAQVYQGRAWRYWAEGWLTGRDRTVAAAQMAQEAMWRRALRADRKGKPMQAREASAARDALQAARELESASPARLARLAAWAVEEAVRPLDLPSLAHWAMSTETRLPQGGEN